MKIESTSSTVRQVAMLIYPQVASSDVCGPLEPFGLGNFLTGCWLYDPITVTVTTDGAPDSIAGGFLKLEPSCTDLPSRIDLF